MHQLATLYAASDHRLASLSRSDQHREREVAVQLARLRIEAD